MRIIFTKEPDGTTAAISLDAEYKGFLHEELYWCDICKALGGVMVRWQSDYSNPVHFSTDAEARKHVLENYKKYTPHSNGRKFQLDEE